MRRRTRNSIPLRTELDRLLPKISADRVQVQQVLMNLMLNGIEAMKDTGGELTMTSKTDEEPTSPLEKEPSPSPWFRGPVRYRTQTSRSVGARVLAY